MNRNLLITLLIVMMLVAIICLAIIVDNRSVDTVQTSITPVSESSSSEGSSTESTEDTGVTGSVETSGSTAIESEISDSSIESTYRGETTSGPEEALSETIHETSAHPVDHTAVTYNSRYELPEF